MWFSEQWKNRRFYPNELLGINFWYSPEKNIFYRSKQTFFCLILNCYPQILYQTQTTLEFSSFYQLIIFLRKLLFFLQTLHFFDENICPPTRIFLQKIAAATNTELHAPFPVIEFSHHQNTAFFVSKIQKFIQDWGRLTRTTVGGDLRSFSGWEVSCDLTKFPIWALLRGIERSVWVKCEQKPHRVSFSWRFVRVEENRRERQARANGTLKIENLSLRACPMDGKAWTFARKLQSWFLENRYSSEATWYNLFFFFSHHGSLLPKVL